MFSRTEVNLESRIPIETKYIYLNHHDNSLECLWCSPYNYSDQLLETSSTRYRIFSAYYKKKGEFYIEYEY